MRFLVFCVSGFFAGIAGGLAAINYEIVTAERGRRGARPGYVLLDGLHRRRRRSSSGRSSARLLVTALQISLSDYTKAWLLYFGLLFVLMVMYAPGGIASLVADAPAAAGGAARCGALLPCLLPLALAAG